MNTTCSSPAAIPKAALKPSITIVVSPQEHFGYTQQSLDSIYQNTKIPFELVYIDAGSPKHIQTYLVAAAAKHNFTLIRCDHFLPPNQARNLGLSQLTTDYIVFLTNDIHVSPGWLERLWNCAQEMDAAAVCPETYVGAPLHEPMPPSHDITRILMDIQGEHIRRHLQEKLSLPNGSTTAIQPQRYKQICGFPELNCLLVKRDVIAQVGYLDSSLVGPQADLDFCLSIKRIDGPIFCETASVVTHVLPKPQHWSDWYTLMLRWSDAWELESLVRFQQKWDLDMDYYFQQHYKQLGHRRHQTFLYPLLHRLTGGNIAPWLEQLAITIEKWINQILTDRHAQASYDAIGELVPPNTTSAQTPSFKQMLQQAFFQAPQAQASHPHLSQ